MLKQLTPVKVYSSENFRLELIHLKKSFLEGINACFWNSTLKIVEESFYLVTQNQVGKKAGTDVGPD